MACSTVMPPVSCSPLIMESISYWASQWPRRAKGRRWVALVSVLSAAPMPMVSMYFSGTRPVPWCASFHPFPILASPAAPASTTAAKTTQYNFFISLPLSKFPIDECRLPILNQIANRNSKIVNVFAFPSLIRKSEIENQKSPRPY